MTPEQMQEMIKAIGPEMARALVAAAQSNTAPDNAGPKAKSGIFSSTETLGAYVKSIIGAGKTPNAEALESSAKRMALGREDVVKAVQLSKYDSAGVLAPVTNSGEMIEFLRPDSVLLQMGVRVQPFKGELNMGKQTSGATFRWVGEGETVPKSDIKYGKIVLKAHKGMVLVDISNDLLRTPGVGDAGVGEDIRRTVAGGLDDGAINGDGSAASPRGLLNQLLALAPTHSFTNAGITAAQYTADIDKMIEKPLTANVVEGASGFLLNPTRATALLQLKDSGIFVFRNEMLDRGTIRGKPFKLSNRVDATRIVYSADWRQFIYGVDEDLILSEHDTRADYDETTIRGIVKGDFKLRQPPAFSESKGY